MAVAAQQTAEQAAPLRLWLGGLRLRRLRRFDQLDEAGERRDRKFDRVASAAELRHRNIYELVDAWRRGIGILIRPLSFRLIINERHVAPFQPVPTGSRHVGGRIVERL